MPLAKLNSLLKIARPQVARNLDDIVQYGWGIFAPPIFLGANMEIGGLSGDNVVQTLSQIIPLLIGVIVGIIVLEFALYNFLSRVVKTQHALAYTLLSPAAIALVLFLIYPLLFNVLLAFSDLKRNT